MKFGAVVFLNMQPNKSIEIDKTIAFVPEN